MQRAIALSLENVRGGRGGPFGAVVVRDGVIVGEGVNEVTSLPDPTAHAEVMAIRAACRRLNAHTLEDCELYTSCEPCPMCLGAIYWAHLPRFWYGNTREDAARIGFDDDLIYRELALPMDERQVRAEPLLHEAALEAFRAWEKSAAKVRY